MILFRYSRGQGAVLACYTVWYWIALQLNGGVSHLWVTQAQTSASYLPSALSLQVMSAAHHLRLVSLLVLVIAIIVSVVIRQHSSEAGHAATRNNHLHEMDDCGHLVTLANPAREDATLDYERCGICRRRLLHSLFRHESPETSL